MHKYLRIPLPGIGVPADWRSQELSTSDSYKSYPSQLSGAVPWESLPFTAGRTSRTVLYRIAENT